MSRILIKNGKVFDGKAFKLSDVLIFCNKIAEIKENINETADFIYDAKGDYVSAGFVDIHSHIFGVSSENFGTPADSSFFPFGVTAGVDAGACQGKQNILDSFKMKSGVFVSLGFNEGKLNFDTTEKLLNNYGDKVLGIKFCLDEKSYPFCKGVHLKQAVDFAEKQGHILMVHCSNTPISMEEIVDVLRKGDIITHTYHGGVNNCLVNNFTPLKRAKEKGVILDVGMAGHIHTDFNVLKTAVEQGFKPDTISTDLTKLSAFTRGGKYGMTLCMSVLYECGMSDEEIFKAVTVNPAKAVLKEWGSLNVGDRADITVIALTDMPFCFDYGNTNHLSGKRTFDCKLTICDGTVVYRK